MPRNPPPLKMIATLVVAILAVGGVIWGAAHIAFSGERAVEDVGDLNAKHDKDVKEIKGDVKDFKKEVRADIRTIREDHSGMRVEMKAQTRAFEDFRDEIRRHHQ